MVNSGLVKTAATNHGIMSENKDWPMWAIQEDDYDFPSESSLKNQEKKDNLLKLMS